MTSLSSSKQMEHSSEVFSCSRSSILCSPSGPRSLIAFSTLILPSAEPEPRSDASAYIVQTKPIYCALKP
jgi:hypothetical protein